METVSAYDPRWTQTTFLPPPFPTWGRIGRLRPLSVAWVLGTVLPRIGYHVYIGITRCSVTGERRSASFVPTTYPARGWLIDVEAGLQPGMMGVHRERWYKTSRAAFAHFRLVLGAAFCITEEGWIRLVEGNKGVFQ